MTDNWTEVGRVDDIPRLGSRVVKSRSGEIALFRASDDEIFALANRCPHKGGPLSEGIVAGHRVTCPLHNWIIDLKNGEAAPPDEGCTPAYPVKLEDGAIFIDLSAVGKG